MISSIISPLPIFFKIVLCIFKLLLHFISNSELICQLPHRYLQKPAENSIAIALDLELNLGRLDVINTITNTTTVILLIDL